MTQQCQQGLRTARRRPIWSVGAAVTWFAVMFGNVRGAPAAPPRQPVAGSPAVAPVGVSENDRVIVRVRSGVSPVRLAGGGWSFAPNVRPPGVSDHEKSPIAAVLRQSGAHNVTPVFKGPHTHATRASELGLDRYYRIDVAPGSDTALIARELKRFATRFDVAEADGVGGIAVIPNDEYFDLQWGLHNTGQGGGTVDADCDAVDAWDLDLGSAQVVLAVLDTGVQHFDSQISGSADHPDLAGRVVSGWNTRDDTADTTDPHGHGTHCAGIAAATGNNGIGVAGMNWNVTILAMRVTAPDGQANQTDVATAVAYAVDHGADIVSMSLQFYGSTNAPLQGALQYAHDNGVLALAATGNFQPEGIVAYPARYPLCMAIGATQRFDGHAGFSNSGPEIDLSAPGAEIFGLWRDSNYTLGFPAAPVGVQSGTSMSTPLVAGIAALMKSVNPSLGPDQLEHLLKVACEDKGPVGWDKHFGYGRINARIALLAAARPTDLNHDGEVDIDDLLIVINAWGECVPANPCAADVNVDGEVDIDDLLALLMDWG